MQKNTLPPHAVLVLGRDVEVFLNKLCQEKRTKDHVILRDWEVDCYNAEIAEGRFLRDDASPQSACSWLRMIPSVVAMATGASQAIADREGSCATFLRLSDFNSFEEWQSRT